MYLTRKNEKALSIQNTGMKQKATMAIHHNDSTLQTNNCQRERITAATYFIFTTHLNRVVGTMFHE